MMQITVIKLEEQQQELLTLQLIGIFTIAIFDRLILVLSCKKFVSSIPEDR